LANTNFGELMISTVAPPTIIQGGMGVAVSNWQLARAVSLRGQLGVISGTALDPVLVRRLQDGDAGGHMRRAMNAFPVAGVAESALERFFLPEGRAEGEPYRLLPMYRRTVSRERNQLTMLANFVEVFLAKEGHDGVVGISLLTKVQMPNIASLYGAMLAGVDYSTGYRCAAEPVEDYVRKGGNEADTVGRRTTSRQSRAFSPAATATVLTT
jgi:NAD(P)H-dependent flavin oxidoreductase YrpB (nitropropane dioxygenase family)